MSIYSQQYNTVFSCSAKPNIPKFNKAGKLKAKCSMTLQPPQVVRTHTNKMPLTGNWSSQARSQKAPKECLVVQMSTGLPTTPSHISGSVASEKTAIYNQLDPCTLHLKEANQQFLTRSGLWWLTLNTPYTNKVNVESHSICKLHFRT